MIFFGEDRKMKIKLYLVEPNIIMLAEIVGVGLKAGRPLTMLKCTDSGWAGHEPKQ